MGHAAFERAQEDRDAYKEFLKEQEELWAEMASAVSISYKEVDSNLSAVGKRGYKKKGPRTLGTNPRAKGTNPRAKGTNPRAKGTNPRRRMLCPKAFRPAAV